MTDQETIPPAGSLSEVNIHLGYLRRDVQDLGKKIDDQSAHYINVDEFKPVLEQLAKHDRDIEKLLAFANTLTGKLIGFGLAMGAAFAIISIGVQILFHI